MRADNSKESLRSIFRDEHITKIFHGGDSDIKFLVADLGICTINFFDTQRAFNLIKKIPSLNEFKR